MGRVGSIVLLSGRHRILNMDEFLRFIKSLLERLFTRELVISKEGELSRLRYADNSWQPMTESSVSEPLAFGERVVLIPDAATLFRYREFPADHVKQSELDEAIRLDAINWSPWQEGNSLYYWPVLDGGVWRVGVWICPQDYLHEQYGDALETASHLMPEIAWRIATVEKHDLPAILVHRGAGETRAAVIPPVGVPQRISVLQDEVAEDRFWRSLDEDEREWEICESDAFSGLPGTRALQYARNKNVQDWRDPLSWRRPAGAVLAFYLLWIVGNGAVVWQQAGSVNDMMSAAQRAAGEVVTQRERVTVIHETLLRLHALRERQPALAEFFALLSEHLPPDVTLDAVQYTLEDGGTVELQGKAEQVVVLPALLEALPEIDYAALRGSIRKDTITGLTPFRMRIVLNTRPVEE